MAWWNSKYILRFAVEVRQRLSFEESEHSLSSLEQHRSHFFQPDNGAHFPVISLILTPSGWSLAAAAEDGSTVRAWRYMGLLSAVPLRNHEDKHSSLHQ